MHKLHRHPLAPACLGKYRHGQDKWTIDSPSYGERQEIWARLDAMQGQRCAYCEASIREGTRHIEHFRQRDRYPQGTFAWDNLFGSCDRQNTCGDHKDKCGAYDHTHVIKPDVDDPERFLVFAPDGSVNPRAGLTLTDTHRACETIRILNLNGALRQIRRREVAGYVQTATEIAEIAVHFPEAEWMPLLQEELDRTAQLPFATAIRHVLTRVS